MLIQVEVLIVNNLENAGHVKLEVKSSFTDICSFTCFVFQVMMVIPYTSCHTMVQVMMVIPYTSKHPMV